MADQEMFCNASFHCIPTSKPGLKINLRNKGGCDQIGKEVLTQDGFVTLCLTEKKSSGPSLPIYLQVYNSPFSFLFPEHPTFSFFVVTAREINFFLLTVSEFPKVMGTGASGELLNSSYLVILLPVPASPADSQGYIISFPGTFTSLICLLAW